MADEKAIYRVINEINLSMTMEDMPLTPQNKQIMYDCIVGKLDINAVLESTIKKYSVSAA